MISGLCCIVNEIFTLHTYCQPRQQQKAVNNFPSHFPVRTLSIKKLSNQCTQLEKIFAL